MMDYMEIRQMPTGLDAEKMKRLVETGCAGAHESVVRSYHIVEKIKWLLEKNTHPEVIRDLIRLMESSDA